MKLPLKKLVSYKENIYELVSATIKRAQQITDVRAAFNLTTLEEQAGEEVMPNPQQQKLNEDKASSLAFKEILDGDVIYKVREE